MDFLNAIVALCNYVIVPGVTYGSQLALGALGVTAALRWCCLPIAWSIDFTELRKPSLLF